VGVGLQQAAGFVCALADADSESIFIVLSFFLETVIFPIVKEPLMAVPNACGATNKGPFGTAQLHLQSCFF
jgi:hypothetical protein